MKKIFWIFPVIPVILISTFFGFNYQNSYFLEEDAPYPYFVDNENMLNVIESSSTIDSFIFEMYVIDNENNDFYENAKSPNNNFTVFLETEQFEEEIPVNFLLNQSNPTENEYRFLADLSVLDNENIFKKGDVDTINNFGIALNSGDSSVEEHLIAKGSTNYELAENKTNFNVIDSNNNINDKKFIINNLEEGHSDNIKFFLPIENIGVESKTPTTLEITLQDMSNLDERTNTKTYTANLIDENNQNGKYYQIEGLDANKPYKFISINNSDLTVDDNNSYNPDNNILFEEDLGYEEEDLLFNTNPYLLDDGSSLTIIPNSYTINSIQFNLNVIDNAANDFYKNLIKNENKVEVTLNNYNDESTNITQATYIGSDKPEDGIYTFEINDLESNTDYELVSLNNTGLSVGNGINEQDSSISLDEINVENNTFKTESQVPYIIENSFKITSATDISVIFEMQIQSTKDITYNPKDIEVIMIDSNGIYHNSIAHFLPENSDISNSIYVYEINELDISTNENFKKGTEYQIYSLENTGLAVNNSAAEIDNSINIEEDLNQNGNFTTIGNPYIISNDGFKIIETSKDSIKFELTIMDGYGNEYIPPEEINVTIKDSNKISNQTTAKYLYKNKEESNYIFEINELNSSTHEEFAVESNYEIYSLDNINLAIDDDSADIQSTILTSSLVTNENQLFFEINQINWLWLLLLILLIILFLIGILVILKVLNKRRKEDLNKKIEDLIEIREEDREIFIDIPGLVKTMPIKKIASSKQIKELNNEEKNKLIMNEKNEILDEKDDEEDEEKNEEIEKSIIEEF